MQHTIRTAIRTCAGTALLAAALASAAGTASAQVTLDPAVSPASPIVQAPCIDTNPANPTINLLACLTSLSASASAG